MRADALEIANDADLRIRAPKAKFGSDATLDPKLSVSRKVTNALDPRLPPPGTYLASRKGQTSFPCERPGRATTTTRPMEAHSVTMTRRSFRR